MTKSFQASSAYFWGLVAPCLMNTGFTDRATKSFKYYLAMVVYQEELAPWLSPRAAVVLSLRMK